MTIAPNDVLVEMHWHGRPESTDRRRRLLAWSRYADTPRQLQIELTADGTDYIAADDDEPSAEPCAIIRQLLATDPGQTTRDLLSRWPAASPRPLPGVLNRHLSRMVDDGELSRMGEGHRFEPYRYRLVRSGEAGE